MLEWRRNGCNVEGGWRENILLSLLAVTLIIQVHVCLLSETTILTCALETNFCNPESKKLMTLLSVHHSPLS